jgi:hypothetical protein
MDYFTPFDAFTLNDVKLKVNSSAKIIIIVTFDAMVAWQSGGDDLTCKEIIVK